ncbi:MAG TPA: hypothetical protein DIW47_05715 [Bacteroidetes bacterium]|nr:hypothetical protein [Bacteroidota bacterium]
MNQIIPPINNALQAMIRGFVEGTAGMPEKEGDQLLERLTTLLSRSGDFKSKLADLEKSLDDHPAFEPLYHYLFDLLMLSFIASDAAQLDENYLDSEEWMKIEDETSDRGSELLNLYIYLSEAYEQEIPVDLNDYLTEFLLADDDLYQDDFFIYEEIISNEDIAEASISEIVQLGENVKTEELTEIFVPLLAFFITHESREEVKKTILHSQHQKALHLALYGTLCAFADGLQAS